MLRVTPKPFDAINMIAWLFSTHKCLRMVDRMMFPIAFQGLVPSKSIGVIHGPVAGLGLDMPHQFVSTHRFNHFGIHAGFPLQKPKNNTFSCGRPAPFALTPSPE